MSIADAIPVRLSWDGRSGVARTDEVSVTLRVRPRVMVWAAVDYAPGYCAECRDRDIDRTRPLEPDEIRSIEAYLASVAQGARDRL